MPIQGAAVIRVGEAGYRTVIGAAGAADPLTSYVSAEIHQASGMLMVQLGISIEAALARLRAYAFAEGRSLADVAHAVVERTLDLRDDDR
ncbi:ANTAR domain-containing protein [Microlunatus elymi]|nr:ANTAR domain-containing protein [Microlunatus elymi]